MDKPLCYLGVDIAYRRDTAAVAAVYRHREWGKFCLYDHRIWQPPVHIPHVTDAVLRFLRDHRCGGIFFDPFQWMSESQKLAEMGYERLLREVNQSSEMVEIGNNLHGTMVRGDFLRYSDPEVSSQFGWCAAEATERGYRIVKQKQSKPIDVVVAIAMALWGACQDFNYLNLPSYTEDDHAVSLSDL